jgi:hypothetical protein
MAAQARAFEKREQSRSEIQYGNVMEKSAAVLRELSRTATFDQLLSIEKDLQSNDLQIYAKVPSTLKAVREGISEIKSGENVYRQLLTNTKAYLEHDYRDKEKAAPDRLVPLDAMRRALRGQASRVENYRKNVMGNPKEHVFMSARVAMIRRAEKLYDAIQRDQLLPPPEQNRGGEIPPPDGPGGRGDTPAPPRANTRGQNQPGVDKNASPRTPGQVDAQYRSESDKVRTEIESALYKRTKSLEEKEAKLLKTAKALNRSRPNRISNLVSFGKSGVQWKTKATEINKELKAVRQQKSRVASVDSQRIQLLVEGRMERHHPELTKAHKENTLNQWRESHEKRMEIKRSQTLERKPKGLNLDAPAIL